MALVDDHECYYPYKQPASVPFKWEIRPGVPKHSHNSPQPKTRLKPPPPVSTLYPLEEPRTRSFLSTPRTRPILSSSPRTHSQRVVSKSAPLRPGPELVGPGCFPSPVKPGRVKTGRSIGSRRRVESEFGFDFGPDYGSDLETLVRWSSSISAMRKSNAAFHNSSPDSASSGSTSSVSPVSHAEWAALNLF